MRLIDADQFGVIALQGKSKDFIDGTLFILDKIYEAPTIEDRPHGEWIEHRQFNPIGCFYSEYECSNCHDDVWQKTEWQFCPNCGARMRGEEK